MKGINISKKKFEELDKLELPKEVLSTESALYLYSFRGNEKILKKLHKTNGEYFATKLYTVAMLDECREELPPSFVVPDYTLSINHEQVGFTVPKVKGKTLSTILSDKRLDPKMQIGYLMEIGEILKHLDGIRRYRDMQGIFINDVNESNFMIRDEDGKVCVIDLDSCKIENNKIFPARYLSQRGLLSQVPDKYTRNEKAWKTDDKKEYEAYSRLSEGFYIPSPNTDLYCYSIIILNYLYGDNINNMSLEEFYNYLNYLTYIGVNKELLDCLANIVNTPDNYNPGELLETLTNENVCRAHKNIYKLNKKKMHLS